MMRWQVQRPATKIRGRSTEPRRYWRYIMKRCLNVLPAYLKAVITAGALTMASALVIAPASAQVNCAPGMQGPVAFNPPPPAVGTFANPWINQRHVLCGEINRWGNAVGWHYRQGGNDPVFAGGPDIQLQAKNQRRNQSKRGRSGMEYLHRQ